jgi:tetratricopeptide (TPR) repeat protein
VRCLFGLLGLAAVQGVPAAEPDVLQESLLGEFALQSGDIPDASTHYVAAALASTSPELIERAVTVALYAKDYAAAEAVGQRWLDLDARSVPARRALAWSALATGRKDRAQALLVGLMQDASLDGQRAVAQVLVAAENREHAPGCLKALAEQDLLVAVSGGPNWSAVASNLKEYDTAARLAETETRASPKDAEAWRRLAQVQLAREDQAAAEKALLRAVHLAPADFELRLALASLQSEAGRVDAADRVLADAPKQDDRTFAARLANVASKPDARLLTRVQKALERSTRETVQTRAFLLGQLAELRKQTDAALDWYAQEPKGAAWHDAQLRRSVLLARDKHDLAGARTLLAAVRADTDDVDAKVDAYLLETELLLPEQRATAAKVFDEALSLHPRDIRLLYSRALFREGDDDLAGLEADLRSILALDPDNPQALNALGYTLADRTDRYQEALVYIQKALAAQPDDAAFVDSMGWVQYRLGNLPEAIVHLRRAYELSQDADVAAHLGEVLWVAGEHTDAVTVWRDALQRWPENESLKNSILRLHPDLLR